MQNSILQLQLQEETFTTLKFALDARQVRSFPKAVGMDAEKRCPYLGPYVTVDEHGINCHLDGFFNEGS